MLKLKKTDLYNKMALMINNAITVFASTSASKKYTTEHVLVL